MGASHPTCHMVVFCSLREQSSLDPVRTGSFCYNTPPIEALSHSQSVSMASMTCVTPHPALGGTSRGFSLAADILLHRAHVVNRRLAAVSLSPLPLPDDRDGIHGEHTAAPHHRPDNEQAVLQQEDGDLNGRTRTEPHETSCVDVPLSVDSVTQSDEGILMDDVLEAEVTAVDVPAAGGWFSEAAGRLCDWLDVSSVAEVASSQQVVALCGPEEGPRKLWLRKLVPRQPATPAEYDLVIKGGRQPSCMNGSIEVVRKHLCQVPM